MTNAILLLIEIRIPEGMLSKLSGMQNVLDPPGNHNDAMHAVAPGAKKPSDERIRRP